MIILLIIIMVNVGGIAWCLASGDVSAWLLVNVVAVGYAFYVLNEVVD